MLSGRKQTLNSRLLALGMGTIFSFSAVFVVVSYVTEQLTIERSLLSVCQTVSARLSAALAIPVWNYDLPNIRASLLAEVQSQDICQITVHNEQGKLVAWASRYRDGQVATGGSVPDQSRNRSSVFHSTTLPVQQDGRIIGQVSVSVSSDARMQEFASQMLRTVFTLLINTIVCISVLLVAVRRTIVRRITALSRVVRDFSESGFASRMPVDRPDEIGQLATSFNSMAQTISDYSLDMEKQVSERSAQLAEAEKLAFLGSLVAGFSHEINTPLGIAMTANSYQESRLKEVEARFRDGSLTKNELQTHFRDLLTAQQLVQSNLERANRLVTTFKGVGIDQVSGDRHWVKLRDFLQDVSSSQITRLQACGIELRLEIAPEIRILTAPGALQQIFSLLLLNVLVHAYPAGGPGLVTISASPCKDGICCVFRDRGQGIPPDLMPRIFTPFFTTRRSEGFVGLGLYIVYTAIRKLDGSVSCECPADGGLQFTMVFPSAT